MAYGARFRVQEPGWGIGDAAYLQHLENEAARSGARVSRNQRLSDLSRWKIGGPAELVIEPTDERSLSSVLAELFRGDVPYIVVGDGSNLLFDDDGFRGVVLRLGRAMARMSVDGTRVTAQAGAWVPAFARFAGTNGLSGIEHTVGIPGTVGGLVAMNGGSQRKGIGDRLVEAVCVDPKGQRHAFTRDECGFAYRTSVFQKRPLTVVEVTLDLERGSASAIRSEMIGIMADRRRKFPLKLPNCGSVFVSDPAMYATVGPPGKAIEQAGLRGHRIGNAQVSERHGNFIVNLGGASSRDVLELIELIRHAVKERTGHSMVCEVRYVAPDGTIRPASIGDEGR